MVTSRTRRSCPTPQLIDRIEEPIVKVTIHVPAEYVGAGARALPGAARHAEGRSSTRRRPRHHHLRDAARRGALRLPRQAEERVARLRVDGLRARRLPRRQPREARHARERRAARRAAIIVHRDKAYAPRPRPRREAEGVRAAPAVRGRDPGGDRREDHRARDREGHAQGRHREVLRRRHHAASGSSSRSRKRARSA